MGVTNYNSINWWRVFSINSSVFNFTHAFLIAAENIEFYQLRPGILCVDVHKTEGNRVVTGGVDAQARQMRPPAFLQSSFRESESSPFMPIPFAQTSVGSVGQVVLFMTFAAQVVLFDAEKGSMVQKLTGHAKKVTSVSLHATKDKLSGWNRFELAF